MLVVGILAEGNERGSRVRDLRPPAAADFWAQKGEAENWDAGCFQTASWIPRCDLAPDQG